MLRCQLHTVSTLPSLAAMCSAGAKLRPQGLSTAGLRSVHHALLHLFGEHAACEPH